MTEPAAGQNGRPSEPQCYNCGGMGHWVMACPEPTRTSPAGLAWRNSSTSGQGGSRGQQGSSKRSKGPIITKYAPPNPPAGRGVMPYPPPPGHHQPPTPSYPGPPPPSQHGPPPFQPPYNQYQPPNPPYHPGYGPPAYPPQPYPPQQYPPQHYPPQQYPPQQYPPPQYHPQQYPQPAYPQPASYGPPHAGPPGYMGPAPGPPPPGASLPPSYGSSHQPPGPGSHGYGPPPGYNPPYPQSSSFGQLPPSRPPPTSGSPPPRRPTGSTHRSPPAHPPPGPPAPDPPAPHRMKPTAVSLSLPPKPPQSRHSQPEPPQHGNKLKRKQERHQKQRENRLKSQPSNQRPSHQRTTSDARRPHSRSGQPSDTPQKRRKHSGAQAGGRPHHIPGMKSPSNDISTPPDATVFLDDGQGQQTPITSPQLDNESEAKSTAATVMKRRTSSHGSSETEASLLDTHDKEAPVQRKMQFELASVTSRKHVNSVHDAEDSRYPKLGSSAVGEETLPKADHLPNVSGKRKEYVTKTSEHLDGDRYKARQRFLDDSEDEQRYSKRPRHDRSPRRGRKDSAGDEASTPMWHSVDQPDDKARRGSDSRVSLPPPGGHPSRFPGQESRGSRSSSVSSRSSDLNSLEAELLGRPAKQASPSSRDERQRRDRSTPPKRKRRQPRESDSAYSRRW